jgi:hypothetical protein
VRQWLGFLGLRTVVRVLEKLRTVLPLTVGIRDGAVQLVSTVVAPSPQHEQGSGIIAHRGGKLAGRVVFHARQPRGGGAGHRCCVPAAATRCISRLPKPYRVLPPPLCDAPALTSGNDTQVTSTKGLYKVATDVLVATPAGLLNELLQPGVPTYRREIFFKSIRHVVSVSPLKLKLSSVSA